LTDIALEANRLENGEANSSTLFGFWSFWAEDQRQKDAIAGIVPYYLFNTGLRLPNTVADFSSELCLMGPELPEKCPFELSRTVSVSTASQEKARDSQNSRKQIDDSRHLASLL